MTYYVKQQHHTKNRMSLVNVANKSVAQQQQQQQQVTQYGAVIAGADPTIWGPLFWHLLFDLCFRAQHNQYVWPQLIHLLKSLRFLLPCKHCRISYSEYIKDLPPKDYILRGKALKWVYKIKNKVNAKLGKPQTLTFKDFKRRMRINSQLLSNEGWWDIYSILAVHYPNNKNIDKDYKLKRRHYQRFFHNLYFLRKHLFEFNDHHHVDMITMPSNKHNSKWLKKGSMSFTEAVSPKTLHKYDFANKERLYRWVQSRKALYYGNNFSRNLQSLDMNNDTHQNDTKYLYKNNKYHAIYGSS